MIKGSVLKLFLSIKGETKRQQTDTIKVDEDGVQGDKFYAQDPQRLILIASIDSYTMARDAGINIEHGDLGENILIDINPYHLNEGDQFTIGSTTFVITQNGTLCKGLSKLDSRLPKLLKHDRGIFARALSQGSINTKDDVRLS